MDIRLNLATKTYLNRRVVWRWLLLISGLLALILMINLFYGVQNYRQLQKVTAHSSELDKQLAGLQGEGASYSADEYADIRAQVVEVNRIIAADQFLWTDLLSRFEELLPTDVAIRTIQPNYKARSLTINAYAKDVSAMTEFLDRLLSSEDFSQVYLHNQSETAETPGAPKTVNFSLVIEEAF